MDDQDRGRDSGNLVDTKGEKREIIILRKEFISENLFHINEFILLWRPIFIVFILLWRPIFIVFILLWRPIFIIVLFVIVFWRELNCVKILQSEANKSANRWGNLRAKSGVVPPSVLHFIAFYFLVSTVVNPT